MDYPRRGLSNLLWEFWSLYCPNISKKKKKKRVGDFSGQEFIHISYLSHVSTSKTSYSDTDLGVASVRPSKPPRPPGSNCGNANNEAKDV